MTESALLTFRMWQRNRDAFLVSWKANIGGLALEPVIVLVAIGFGLGTLVDPAAIEGLTYAQFIAPGVIAGYVMFHASGESLWGTYLRMVNHRTFEAILATPLDVRDVVLGEMMWSATKAALSAVAIFATAAALGLVTTPTALLVLPLSIAAGFAFSSLTLIYTAWSPSINVLENFYTLLLTPMFFFSGAFYPIDALPDAVQPLVWLLPLTPLVHIFRELMVGEVGLSTLWSFAVLIAWGAIGVPLALRAMRRRLVK